MRRQLWMRASALALLMIAVLVPTTRASAGDDPSAPPAFYLRNSNTSGVADVSFTYGGPGDVPLAGDWDGSGSDTPGVRRGNAFYLRNSNTSGAADLTFAYGDPGDLPLVGDWNGDGVDTIGLYRGNAFYLRNTNSTGVADTVITFGDPGDIPLVGDWDGNGTDTIGIYRDGVFYLRNSNTSGPADVVFRYGDIGDYPIVGDWDGNGTSTVGVVRGSMFYLRNSNTSGNADSAFLYGDQGDVPIVGDWDGNGTSTVGIVRMPPLPHAFDPYRGLGSWVDVFDWSFTHAGSPPPFTLADVDHMADEGVQTMYLQTAHADDPGDILEPGLVNALINRAHLRGMRVVAWYLPDLTDVGADMRHLMAMSQLRVDGLAVDIESTSVGDIGARNAALISLSDQLRSNLPGWVISALVLPPVVTDEINPNYWPDFPWQRISGDYDLWQPMGYWTNRRPPWRDAFAYTIGNIDRLRSHVGPQAVVSEIGGIGDQTSVDDVNGFLQACAQRGCIGGSLYDYRTTDDSLWPQLDYFRLLG